MKRPSAADIAEVARGKGTAHDRAEVAAYRRNRKKRKKRKRR